MERYEEILSLASILTLLECHYQHLKHATRRSDNPPTWPKHTTTHFVSAV